MYRSRFPRQLAGWCVVVLCASGCLFVNREGDLGVSDDSRAQPDQRQDSRLPDLAAPDVPDSSMSEIQEHVSDTVPDAAVDHVADQEPGEVHDLSADSGSDVPTLDTDGVAEEVDAPLADTSEVPEVVTPDSISGVAQVGSAGGMLQPVQGLTLEIPQGALPSEVTLTVTAATLNGMETGLAPVTWLYQLEPGGLQFMKPVTIRIAVPLEALPWATRSAILTRPTPEGPWRALATALSLSEGELVAQTYHFSAFGGFVQTDPSLACQSDQACDGYGILACGGTFAQESSCCQSETGFCVTLAFGCTPGKGCQGGDCVELCTPGLACHLPGLPTCLAESVLRGSCQALPAPYDAMGACVSALDACPFGCLQPGLCAECLADDDCGTPQATCDGNALVVAACDAGICHHELQETCGEGEVCYAGACRCQTGLACENAGESYCDGDLVAHWDCVNGACKKFTAECAAPAHCLDGACVACSDSNPCVPGLFCVNGSCVACRDSSDCYKGGAPYCTDAYFPAEAEYCSKGICTKNLLCPMFGWGCLHDSCTPECGPGLDACTLPGGGSPTTCVGPTVLRSAFCDFMYLHDLQAGGLGFCNYKDESCPPGQACSDGVCSPMTCTVDEDCQGLFPSTCQGGQLMEWGCSETSHLCVQKPIECALGTYCKQGACVPGCDADNDCQMVNQGKICVGQDTAVKVCNIPGGSIDVSTYPYNSCQPSITGHCMGSFCGDGNCGWKCFPGDINSMNVYCGGFAKCNGTIAIFNGCSDTGQCIYAIDSFDCAMYGSSCHEGFGCM